jgi:hypothetical protein
MPMAGESIGWNCQRDEGHEQGHYCNSLKHSLLQNMDSDSLDFAATRIPAAALRRTIFEISWKSVAYRKKNSVAHELMKASLE